MLLSDNCQARGKEKCCEHGYGADASTEPVSTNASKYRCKPRESPRIRRPIRWHVYEPSKGTQRKFFLSLLLAKRVVEKMIGDAIGYKVAKFSSFPYGDKTNTGYQYGTNRAGDAFLGKLGNRLNIK